MPTGDPQPIAGDRLIESLIQRISDLEVAVARLIGGHRSEEPSDGTWNDTEGRRDLCRYITDTPELFSLLYDLDMLPEQVKPLTRDGTAMVYIAQAWKANEETVTKPAIVWHDAKTDPPTIDGSYIAYRRDPSASDDRCVAWYDTVLAEWESEDGEIIAPGPTHWTELPPPP